MESNGYLLKNNVVSGKLLARLRDDIDKAEETQWKLKECKFPSADRDGTIHHLPYYSSAFIELLDMKIFHDEISRFICGKYVINVYNGVVKFPEKESYTDKIHRDIRFFSGNINLSMNMLVMLDEFTHENGATQVYPGSHKLENQPHEKDFEKYSSELIAPEGSVAIFNSNLWHRGGVNVSKKVRRAITITFTHPWLKPQIDFCKLLGLDKSKNLSEHIFQVLGYNHRTPENFEQWFLPEAERFYNTR